MEDYPSRRKKGVLTSKPEVEIIPMDYCHVEQVAEIEKECFPCPWSYEAYLAEMSNPLAVVFVAVSGGNVVGYLDAHHVMDECSLNNIAVTGRYREQGIASRLLQRLYTYAEENDVCCIMLEVRRSNLAAQALYSRDGFEEVGMRPNFYTNPTEDALLMNKVF